MLKAGTETGSLVNHVLSGSGTAPKVGDGATILMWTDRHAGTVVKVSPSGKTVTVREDTATRIDSNGMSESQVYEYKPNALGKEWKFRLTKRGWRSGSTGVLFGTRQAYHDYSF